MKRGSTNGWDHKRFVLVLNKLMEIYMASGTAGEVVQHVPDPEADRVQRLEQELKDLREALTMRRLPGQEPLGAYGAQPF